MSVAVKKASSSTTTPTVNTTVIQELCWTDSECNVAGRFTRIQDNQNLSFPVNINCIKDISAAKVPLSSAVKRYHEIDEISLNGCGVNRENTLGIEYIPDAGAVKVLVIEMFRVKVIKNVSFELCDQLIHLELRTNAITSISSDSFMGLKSLAELVLQNNHLQSLNDTGLTELTNLQSLTITEPTLPIDHSLLFPNNISRITIEAKSVKWPYFPDSLTQLYIANTPTIINRSVVLCQNSSNLQSLALTGCALNDVPMMNCTMLKHFNVSGNQLRSMAENRLINLLTFDISNNQITSIGLALLRSMPRLEIFAAQNNRIDTVANDAFVRNFDLKLVNLSHNQLRQVYTNMPVQQTMQIVINENPWSCRWVLDIAQTHPYLFSNFKFDKSLHRVNIRGLSCHFYEGDEIRNYKQLSTPQAPPADIDGTSTKRNPRDTAILTLVILVLGVALLFILLFLHIKCRRDSQQPFYRTLPFNQRLTERTDYVRRILPPTDYEAPVTSRPVSIIDEYAVKEVGTERVYEEIPVERIKRAGSIERHVDEHFEKFNSLYKSENV